MAPSPFSSSDLKLYFIALSLLVFTSCDNVVSEFVNLANRNSESSSSPVLDSTAPNLSGSLDDGTAHLSLLSSPALSWLAAEDSGAGLSHYEVAIGTSSGGVDVQNWTSIGNVTSTQVTGLSLSDGTKYYCAVRAVDLAGNISSPLLSDGWFAVQMPSALLSIDDDLAFPSTIASPTITWSYPGTLVAGPLGFAFEVALGTSAGASNVVAWESVGTAETWSKSSLSLVQGSRYFASVRLVDNTGHVYSSQNGDGWYAVASVASTARYSIAQNWNAYASAATPTITCPDGVSYFSCLHGGEKRRVDYATAASCTNYSITDELGAFDWACDATGGAGNVFFYSRGLKPDKGLVHLVDASAWKNNRVVVSLSGVPVAASPRTTWWSNTVTPLITAVAFLPAANTIYTVSGTLTIDASTPIELFTSPPFTQIKGVGLVTMPGGKIVFSGATLTMPMIRYGQFFWIEGEFTSVNAAGYIVGGSTQGVFRNSILHQLSGLASLGPSNSWIYNLQMSNMDMGLYAEGGASNNVFEEIRIDNSEAGVYNTDNENNNIYAGLRIANITGNGVYFYASQNTHIIGVTVLNSTTFAITSSGTTNTVLKNVLSINSGAGLQIISENRFTLENIAVSNVDVFTSNNNKFTGNFILNTASSSCLVIGGTSPGMVNTTCANSGASNASVLFVPNFGYTSFVGAVSSEDATNASDSLGVSSYASITDWLKFDNSYRVWGRDFTFAAASNQGKCDSGTCRIFDLSVSPSDAVIKNTSVNATTQNAVFTNGAACPAQLHGNVVTVTAKAAPITYLTHAREIFGNGGNNNGLCESNETCLYMPNFGSYQGSGDFWSNTCTFTNGTVSGVKMHAYPVN